MLVVGQRRLGIWSVKRCGVRRRRRRRRRREK
jgi:hypothetical protein